MTSPGGRPRATITTAVPAVAAGATHHMRRTLFRHSTNDPVAKQLMPITRDGAADASMCPVLRRTRAARHAAAVRTAVATASRTGRARRPTSQSSALEERNATSTECAHSAGKNAAATGREDVRIAAEPTRGNPNDMISISTKKWNEQRVYSSTFPALLRFFHHPVSFDTVPVPDHAPAVMRPCTTPASRRPAGGISARRHLPR